MADATAAAGDVQREHGGATPPTRITVLISGSGTNLQALMDAAAAAVASSTSPQLPHVQFVRVISDRKNAFGLERARAAGIPTTYHGILPYKKKVADAATSPPTDGVSQAASDAIATVQAASPDDAARRAYDTDLAALVLADRPQLVVCAGFMRIVTPAFLHPLSALDVPIINLHPALHGDLIGARCIERAWDEFRAGARLATGIMIHYVIAEVDMGAPIVQQEVSIEGCASLEDLQARIHEAEHVLIVKGTRVAIESAKKS